MKNIEKGKYRVENQETEELLASIRGIALLVYEHEVATRKEGRSQYSLEAANFLSDLLVRIVDELEIRKTGGGEVAA
jgi:hypothetical protein